MGDSTSANYLTWLIYPKGKSEFTVYDTRDQKPTTLMVDQQANRLTLQFKGKNLPHILTINASAAPKK